MITIMQPLIGKKMKKTITYKVIGTISVLINTLIIFLSIYLYYSYNFSGKLYYVMIPNYVLLINALIGIIGIFISVMLYKKRIGIRLFSLITAALWFATLSNYLFPVF